MDNADFAPEAKRVRLPRSEPDVERRGVDPVSERAIGERDLRFLSVPPSGDAEEAVITKESSEIALPWIVYSDALAAAIGAVAGAAAGYPLLIPTLPLPCLIPVISETFWGMLEEGSLWDISKKSRSKSK